MKSLPSRTIAGVLLVGLGMHLCPCAARADEPEPKKPLTAEEAKKRAEEAKLRQKEAAKRVEELKQQLEQAKKRLEEFQKKNDALRKEKELPQPSGGDQKTPAVPPKAANTKDRVLVHPSGKPGFLVIDSTNRAAILKAFEEGGVDFTTPRMGIYEAERHSAEKIRLQVQRADATAKLMLQGGAPAPALSPETPPNPTPSLP